ncbi:hypothetical protein FB547_110184 [Variovorax beijingensis]|uniref:Uncharacterized protein n=1 Tax=Variovorax beijingensis TaxID=2496117 RepID=A0A561BEQ5_9BURK|nr:hypothetical protein [Variovorax beijingensis]TWD77222.1 hypothetical protein FB547_110184 [Variovorax beijingensis]
MSNCPCHSPPFHYLSFKSAPVGVDETEGRYGDVSVETCVHCGQKWLRYHVEYEAFTASGRRFRGLISDEQLVALKPEDAVPFLEKLLWYFKGGSYFGTAGERSSGAVRASL